MKLENIHVMTGKKFSAAFERSWKRNLKLIKKHHAADWFERGRAFEKRLQREK